jgi:hypothetical protein
MNRIQAMALLSVTVFSATIAPTATSQDRVHAGLWQMTTTKAGATINTRTRCMTAEETSGSNGDAKALRDVLEKSFEKASCVVKDIAATEKSISYVVDCGTGASAHTLSSVAEYRGDTFEIQFTVKRGTTADTTVTKGHRVGACT